MGKESNGVIGSDRLSDSKNEGIREEEKGNRPAGQDRTKFERLLNRENPFFDKIAGAMEDPDFHHIAARFPETDLKLLNFFYYSACMMGEAAEIFDHAKKAIVKGRPIDYDKLGGELFDVGWYLEALSNVLNIPLDPAAEKKCAELDKRYRKGYYTGKKPDAT